MDERDNIHSGRSGLPPVHSLGGDEDSAREVIRSMAAEDRVNFLGSLVDSTIDAIIAHRPDGAIVFFNQGASEMLGYTAAEMESLPPYGWVGSESLPGAALRIERILHDGRLGFESLARRKDGTELLTDVRCRRVETAVGPVVVAVIRDISERAEVQRALRHLAYHDSLTGLANRAAFDEVLETAIGNARRHSDLLALAYIDLDEFKPVNDQFGHAIGDEILTVIGNRLRSDVRSQDLVARLGGDEFVVVLQRLGSTTELEEIAERFLKLIETPVQTPEHKVSVTASIGMALFDSEFDDGRSLLVKADLAMYAAKHQAAVPWLVYSDEISHFEPPTDR
jgi:diguanylate cyclase (GGDEF)-like protein/PAS domain S-box-containing protein